MVIEYVAAPLEVEDDDEGVGNFKEFNEIFAAFNAKEAGAYTRLNLSAFYGIGGARRDCVARVKGVFRVCWVFLCVRHGFKLR